MSTYSRPTPAYALAALLLIGAIGCTEEGDPVYLDEESPAFSMHGQGAGGATAATINEDLATLRRLLAPFHRLEVAMDAGWDELLTPCLENPPEGGMGFHYANEELLDGEVNLLEPEALLFAPWPNGDVKFVAVEYIVPIGAWEGEDPPTLLGQEFGLNEPAGIWALHIWLWQHNPSGLFADWNPRISC